MSYHAFGASIPAGGATATVIPCPDGYRPSFCGPCIPIGKADDPTCGSGAPPGPNGEERYGDDGSDNAPAPSSSDSSDADTSSSSDTDTSSGDDSSDSGTDESTYDDGSDGGDGGGGGGGGGGAGSGGGGGSAASYYAGSGPSGAGAGAPGGSSFVPIALGVGVVGLIGYFFFRSVS